MLKLLHQHKDTILKYLICAVLMVIPLYPKFPFFKIPGIYVAIRLEDFLIVIVGLIFLLLFTCKWKEILSGKIERAILIFLAVGLVSLVGGVFLSKTATAHIAVLHWLRRIEYLLMFFIGSLFIKYGQGQKSLEFILKTLMLVVVVLFIYGLGQRYLTWPVIITQNEEYSKGIALRWVPGSHINSTFAGHYDLATFLVLLLPVFINSLVLIKGKLSKLSLLAVILAGLWLLVNAVSRISIVSYLLGASVGLLLARKARFIPLVILVSIVFFAFSSDLLARYTRVFEVYGQESKRTSEPQPEPVFEDRSTSIRLNVEWPRAVRAFAKSPLIGTGYSSISLATDNDYLRLLGETGILGFTSFLLILFRVGKSLWIKIKANVFQNNIEKAVIAGLTGGMIGVLVNACFIDVFEASKFALIFWLLIGYSVYLVKRNNNEQETYP